MVISLLSTPLEILKNTNLANIQEGCSALNLFQGMKMVAHVPTVFKQNLQEMQKLLEEYKQKTTLLKDLEVETMEEPLGMNGTMLNNLTNWKTEQYTVKLLHTAQIAALKMKMKTKELACIFDIEVNQKGTNVELVCFSLFNYETGKSLHVPNYSTLDNNVPVYAIETMYNFVDLITQLKIYILYGFNIFKYDM